MKSSLFLGCLAPGWVIQWSYWIAWSGLALASALTVACFIVELRRRSFRWLLMYAALLALQPGWHLLHWDELHDGVMHVRADCGYGLRSLSLFLLGISVALLIIVWRRPRLGRRSFVFGVVLAFTLLNIIDLLYHFTPLYDIAPQSAWFYEIYESIFFPRIGVMPLDTLILLFLCTFLYFLQRLRLRKAV